MNLLDFFRSVFVGKNETKNQPVQSISKPKRVRRESSKITKQNQVKQHLIEKGTITSWEAIDLYGATRLSAIIFRFRNNGMHIESIKLTAIDRNGNTSNFVKYQYINGTN